jgi:hypothetical protein
MDIHLVVVKPFWSQVRGNLITDSAQVRQILDSEHVKNVVRVAAQPAKGN